VPVLQSGRIDIAFSNTVSTLQAIEQGLDAILLAPGAVVRASPPDTTTALIVRKGAVNTLKDLEGKRVAVNVINSSAWLHAVAALEKHGVDRTKVRFTEVPFPQMNDPLLNGQLDAVVQVEPFRSALMATDKAEIVSWTYVETAPLHEYRHGMLEFGSSVPDLVPAFRQLDLPVLGVCGANDPYPDKPEVLAGMKNFREAPSIPGAGRFVHWERPREFNAAVREFLRTLA
jgi:pimeloyl-ACP methyl ester carboxylesterase